MIANIRGDNDIGAHLFYSLGSALEKRDIGTPALLGLGTITLSGTCLSFPFKMISEI
jgi:hypothetical protein